MMVARMNVARVVPVFGQKLVPILERGTLGMSNWKWACHKKGHVPNPKAPESLTEFGDVTMLGSVCINCGCVFYLPTSKFHVTSIIQP